MSWKVLMGVCVAWGCFCNSGALGGGSLGLWIVGPHLRAFIQLHPQTPFVQVKSHPELLGGCEVLRGPLVQLIFQ